MALYCVAYGRRYTVCGSYEWWINERTTTVLNNSTASEPNSLSHRCFQVSRKYSAYYLFTVHIFFCKTAVCFSLFCSGMVFVWVQFQIQNSCLSADALHVDINCLIICSKYSQFLVKAHRSHKIWAKRLDFSEKPLSANAHSRTIHTSSSPT